jgi:hypothetical protein
VSSSNPKALRPKHEQGTGKTPSLMPNRKTENRKSTLEAIEMLVYRTFYMMTKTALMNAPSKTNVESTMERERALEAVGTGATFDVSDSTALFSKALALAVEGVACGDDGAAVMGKPLSSYDLGWAV